MVPKGIICFLSPLVRFKTQNSIVLRFGCPRNCEAKLFLGDNYCVASLAFAIASCKFFIQKLYNSNSRIKINFPCKDLNEELITALADLIYDLRFKSRKTISQLLKRETSSRVERFTNVSSNCTHNNELVRLISIGNKSIYYNLEKVNRLKEIIDKYYYKYFDKRIRKSIQRILHLIDNSSSILEFIDLNKLSKNSEINAKSSILSYTIGDLFRISIASSSQREGPIYIVSYIDDVIFLLPVVWSLSLIAQLKNIGHIKAGHGFISRIMTARIKYALKALKELYPEVPSKQRKTLSLIASLDSIGFAKLIPFLLDDNVEEIFIDSPNSVIYLDHAKLGRCKSNVIVTRYDVERLITQLKAESGLRLDVTSPSLKTDVRTKFFHIRASIDIPPLAVDGPALIFRRFKRKPLTIIDLIKNNTLSLKAASYLIFCLFHKRSIIAVGEPASGKTTLINALDMVTPPHWRKVSIESAIETVEEFNSNQFQVRYRVDPFEHLSPMRRKYYEVIKLLHRSPNYLFIGEVLTREHVHALFYALMSGLKCLGTCHASSPDALLNKWLFHYRVPKAFLSELDIIVCMKRVLEPFLNKRIVWRICEISCQESNCAELRIIDIFRRDAHNRLIPVIDDLFNTPVLKKLKNEELMNECSFYEELHFIEKLIEKLIRKNFTEPKKVRKIFSKAYFLLRSNTQDSRRLMSYVSSI